MLKYDFSKFDCNKEQIAAIKKIKKAFSDAKKLGLVFYAKSDNIVAYTKECDKYVNNEYKGFAQSTKSGCSQLPNESFGNCIIDSGADDYSCFKNEKDYQDYLNAM